MNHLPCVTRLTLIVTGLAFLQPVLSATQFGNMTLIATAVVLGSGFNLSEMSRMWLKARAVSTLSYFFSDAKLELPECQRRYITHACTVYNVTCGYFLVDDTLQHHTRLCQWIHGVCVLFDHVVRTNLKAVCLVVVYYSDGLLIKFRRSGSPNTCGRTTCTGPPAATGRATKRSLLINRSYITTAPATARLMGNFVGILTTSSHSATSSGDSDPRSDPRT